MQNESTVKPKLEIIAASEIEPKEVKWLWYPYFPLGKVSIVQGDPGDGKSSFLLTVAAMLTTGTPLPFTEPEKPPEPMNVIYQTTEDDADDTVVPRFMKANGDRKRLLFIREDKSPLTFADERIGEAIEERDAKLVILDPMSSYIGDCSLNAANEVRPAFNHLIRAAKKYECAIIVVDHMNKADTLKMMYRTPGSIDIVGAVRSVNTIILDPDDSEIRYFVQTKSNLAPMGKAIMFKKTKDDVVTILGEIDATADDLVRQFSARIGRPDSRTQEAILFISEMLSGGALPSKECEAKLREAGIRDGTVKKAKKILGVISTKSKEGWAWSLPGTGQ